MTMLTNNANSASPTVVHDEGRLPENSSGKAQGTARYYQYLKERFPLIQLLTLAAVLSLVAAVGAQVFLNGRLSNVAGIIASFAAALLFLLRLRLVDELKDLEHDRRFYPERPLARGLVRPREVAQAAVLIFILELLVAATGGRQSVIAFSVMALYSFLTLKEFFLRDWLRRHFTSYVLAHEALVLPVCVYLFSLNGLPWQKMLQPYIYLLTMFILGLMCLVEVARKLRPGDPAKNPLDTYTAVYGAAGSGIIAGLLALGSVASGVVTLNLLGTREPFIMLAWLALSVPLALSLVRFVRKPGVDTSRAAFKWAVVLVVGASALFILNAGLNL